jgi:hypothetical protein
MRLGLVVDEQVNFQCSTSTKPELLTLLAKLALNDCTSNSLKLQCLVVDITEKL